MNLINKGEVLDINIYSMFHKLSTKYENIGLKIYIEFTEFGMILRGYWKQDASDINFVRSYSYEMFKHELDDLCRLEDIVDKFKNEFESKLAKRNK